MALENSPVQVSDLASELDISRASLSRNIRYLKEKGWVNEENDRFFISATGRLALESYREFSESIGTVQNLQDFLRWLPPSEALRIDLERLDGSSVVTPEPLNPMLPVNEFTRLLSEAEEARGMTQAYIPALRDCLRDQVGNGMSLRAVLSSGLSDMVRNEEAGCREVAESENARFFLHEGEFPFDLWILDGTLTMMSYDGDGLPRALVKNSNHSAVEWGRELFESYLDGSDELMAEDE